VSIKRELLEGNFLDLPNFNEFGRSIIIISNMLISNNFIDFYDILGQIIVVLYGHGNNYREYLEGALQWRI